MKELKIPLIKNGTVIDHIKAGNLVTRSGWNGKGMYIEIQYPTPSSKMTRPYIFMKTVDNQLVPWVASQSDILADDWELV